MTAAERKRRSRAAQAQERAQEPATAADGELHQLRERVRELEAELHRLRLDGPALLQRAEAPTEHKEATAGRAAPVPPADHNVEAVIRGLRAIARALRTTPAQIQQLRERHGLPVFWAGKVLCARVAELDAWRVRWNAEAGEQEG